MRSFYKAVLIIAMVCFVVLQNIQVGHTQSLLDNLDKLDETLSVNLALSDVLEVNSLVVIMNGNSYVDGVVGDTLTVNEKTTQRLAVLMRYLNIRKGDQLTVKALQRKIKSSVALLSNKNFFDSEEVTISYEAQESNNEIIPVTVYVSVKNEFAFSFGGGVIYGYFGMNYLNGLESNFYLGVNRQEAVVGGVGLAPYKKGSNFGTFMFDVHARFFNYFIWSTVTSQVLSDYLLYGTISDTDFVFNPNFKFRQSVGVLGLSNTDSRGQSDIYLNFRSLPAQGKTNFISLLGSTLMYEQYFQSQGFFQNYIQLSVPYFYGFANNTSVDDTMHWFDLLAYTADMQASFRTGAVFHAFHLRSNFVSPISDISYRPYVAKVNVRRGFFRHTALNIDMGLRGTYPDDVSIGDMGYMASLEYRLGFLRVGVTGFEVFFFYDVGAVTVDTKDVQTNLINLGKNTRHTIGPGITIHIADPVGLMFQANFGIGGKLLGNPDGDAFLFSFSVSARK